MVWIAPLLMSEAIQRRPSFCATAAVVPLPTKGREFVGRWREPILNYFVRRTSSGMVEGLNNKIKLIKRQAFGFLNDAHFRLRVLMACERVP